MKLEYDLIYPTFKLHILLKAVGDFPAYSHIIFVTMSLFPPWLPASLLDNRLWDRSAANERYDKYGFMFSVSDKRPPGKLTKCYQKNHFKTRSGAMELWSMIYDIRMY